MVRAETARLSATRALSNNDNTRRLNVPVSHPFVERLIGTVRRELLDQTLFWNALDLKRKLDSLRHYYNANRDHSSLGGQTPAKASRNRERQRADI